MTISAAITRLQAIAAAQTGVKAAPLYPTESINTFPISLCYASSGNMSVEGAGTGHGLHTLTLELHVIRTNLPQAAQALTAYIEPLLQAIAADPTLAGSVDTIQLGRNAPISYEVRAMDWGQTPTLALIVTVTVKIRPEL